jgi:hypothetical protein
MGEGLKRAKAAAKATRTPQKIDDKHLRLYRAVADYVAANGGKVIVAGGVQCQQYDGHFYIAVKCTGTLPPDWVKP